MDEQHPSSDRTRLIIRRVPQHDAPWPELPPGFAPLRLLLRPGRLCLELHRPSLLLGRHSGADIRLPLPDVSRRHCRFVFADGQWEVVDLSSLNGVFVNGRRLREAVLFQGDSLSIGGLQFTVELPETLAGPVSRGPEDDETGAVLRKIVEVLPGPGSDGTQEYRKAS